MTTNAHKIGLKLWSTNSFYLKPALELYNRVIFDYIELYVVPGSDEDCLNIWKERGIKYFLHAPHSYMGFNLSFKEFETKNRLLLEEVESFRNALNPGYVIFHPGIEGSLDETIRQLKLFQKDFPEIFNSALIENKPRIGLQGETCLGSSPEEIEKIIEETGLGFCLDFGHAICYAAWLGIEWKEIIDHFIKLNPYIFHLSDGNVNSHTDSHLSLGRGNFELSYIIQKIPQNAFVSIEANKNSKLNLTDFEEDITYFNKCLN